MLIGMPGIRVIKRAAERHVQAAVDDDGAQHLDAALLEYRLRQVQCLEFGGRSIRHGGRLC
jgi:hypothetical protein